MYCIRNNNYLWCIWPCHGCLVLFKIKIRDVVMSMDKGDQLEKDMVEQLLKYVPTVAERDLLSSHAHEMESFARPDRFLLEMSRCVCITCTCVLSV